MKLPESNQIEVLTNLLNQTREKLEATSVLAANLQSKYEALCDAKSGGHKSAIATLKALDTVTTSSNFKSDILTNPTNNNESNTSRRQLCEENGLFYSIDSNNGAKETVQISGLHNNYNNSNSNNNKNIHNFNSDATPNHNVYGQLRNNDNSNFNNLVTPNNGYVVYNNNSISNNGNYF